MSVQLWLGMAGCFIALTILLAFLGDRHLKRCKTTADLEKNLDYLFLFDTYGILGLFGLFVSAFTVRHW